MIMLNAQPAGGLNNYNSDVYHYYHNENSFDPLEPGVLPEADLPYKAEYSPDGEKLIIIYHHTDNMIIYDAETKEPLATVDVGEGPVDFEVVGDHIYIKCLLKQHLFLIIIPIWLIYKMMNIRFCNLRE